MKPKTFRQAMLALAAVSTIALISFGVFLTVHFLRPQECPPQLSCPIQEIPGYQENNNEIHDQSRDRRVMDDPLYPPLNRTDARTFNSVNREIDQGHIYSNPRADYGDKYRLIGYLSSSSLERDAGDNRWKLYGRMKNSNQGDFYIIPANKDIDLKIPLTPDVIVGERLKDVYSLPQEMRFRSPMLNAGIYHFVEMPKADFSSTEYA